MIIDDEPIVGKRLKQALEKTVTKLRRLQSVRKH